MKKNTIAEPKPVNTTRRRFLTTVALGAGMAPFVSLSRGLSAGSTAETNSGLCYGAPNVLKDSDFSYLGCMRMPASVDSQFAYGNLTARRVNGQLRFFMYSKNPSGARAGVASASSATVISLGSGQGSSFQVGDKIAIKRSVTGNAVPESRMIQGITGDQITLTSPLGGSPTAGDVVYREQDYYVYEMADTGTYSTDYRTADRMSLVTAWPDIYNGRRVSWEANGNLIAPLGYQIPAGLYWHEEHQLLYWGYFDAYNGSVGRPDWNLGATRLDNAAARTTTSFGPWRTSAVDGDGRVWKGPAKMAFLTAGPDGSMGGFGAYFGAVQCPWGPQLYAGAQWPTEGTPSGFGAPDLSVPHRYVEHYFMGGGGANGFNPDGSVHGVIRSFRYPFSPARPYIYEGLDSPVAYADPAKNDGVCTWTTANGLGGAIWLELGSKRGVLFATSIVGSPETNPANPRAAHVWYRNTGVGNGACKHGVTIPDVADIAGPVASAAFPALVIYDPDKLMAVKNNQQLDYSVEPDSWIDLQSKFGIQTPRENQLTRRNVGGFYFDSSRNYLFVISHGADDSIAGMYQPLIHVFAVNGG